MFLQLLVSLMPWLWRRTAITGQGRCASSQNQTLARFAHTHPGGPPCHFNDIIHWLTAHTMFRICRVITILWHESSNTVRHRWPGTAYCTEILPFIPDNAGILIVPCCRGGSLLPRAARGHIQNGTEPAMMLSLGNGYPALPGFSQQNASRLAKNPHNKFLGVCWMQGEFD